MLRLLSFMPRFFLCGFLLVCGLTACSLSLPREEAPVITVYDLGLPDSSQPPQTARRLWKFQIRAESALDGVSMRYRPAYARPDGALRVLSYTRSFWAAPPSELLRPRLENALFWPSSGARDYCALTLNLTAFEQVFTAPDVSYGQIIARAELWRPDKPQVVDEALFTQRVSASTADAAGGAAALAEAANALAAQLTQWRENARAAAQKDCWRALE